jgi:hypothetical protein
MATTRVRKVGGIYNDAGFGKLVKQLNGRALLGVTLINSNCEECIKLHSFIKHLEHGFIDKLTQLVMVYGFSDAVLSSRAGDESKSEKDDTQPSEDSEEKPAKSARELGDSRLLSWSALPDGHGYALFLSENDILYYKGDFDHDEYVGNIIDNIRRFRSTIKTLAGLKGKRIFYQKKRTGIIIETGGTTSNSQIVELEKKVSAYEGRLQTPVFFCKGLAQEMTYVVQGEEIYKQKGLNFDKLVRKLPRQAT